MGRNETGDGQDPDLEAPDTTAGQAGVPPQVRGTHVIQKIITIMFSVLHFCLAGF